jgi:hypothetical protein
MRRTISAVTALSLLLFATGASSDSTPTAARIPVVKDRSAQPVPNPIHIDQGGDTIASATPIVGLPYTDSGTTTGYVDNYDCVWAEGPDVVYSYTPPADVTVDLDLCGSVFDTYLYVFLDGVNNIVRCNDDACGPQGLQSALHNIGLTAGHTYYIIVDGYYNYHGAYTLTVTPVVGCHVSCPSGSVLEGEPICGDNYHDSFNDGCQGDPPIFSALDCSPTGVQTVCGTYGGFYYNGLSYRDSDWYQIVVPPGPDQAVTWTVRGETDTLTGIIDGRTGCGHTTFYAYTYGGVCTDLTVTGTLAAGTWWFWVGPSNFGSAAGPCGEGYVATLSGFQCQPVAVDPATWGGIKSAYR